MADTNSVRDILEENRRRRDKNEKVFDPLRGDEDDSKRFELRIEEEPGGSLYLPKEMMGERMVKQLVRLGSYAEYDRVVNKRKGRPVKPGSEKSRKRIMEVRREFTKLRIRYDFPYWAAQFVFIKSKGGGGEVRFVLNRPQRKLVAALESMRRAGEPIRLILLKARQWGGSTCVQLYMAWLQLVQQRSLNSLIIAHQRAGTDEILDMFLHMIERYPDWLLNDDMTGEQCGQDTGRDKMIEGEGGMTEVLRRLEENYRCLEEDDDPEGVDACRSDKEGEATLRRKRGKGGRKIEVSGQSRCAFRVPSRNFKVKVGSAERPDACRGGDYNLVHFSEVGLWKATKGKTPEMVVRSACSGVLLRRNTMIVMESTANGTGSYFHTEYSSAKRGESQFKALFVAWFEIDQYSSNLQNPEEFAARLLAGKDDTVRNSTRREPGAYLWSLWRRGATLEAINWYVNERRKYSDHGQMASEYPSDDVEAFVHSGTRVFDRDLVEKMRDDCRLLPTRGEITGDAPFGEEALRGLHFTPSGHGTLKMWEDREWLPLNKVMCDRYLVVVDIGGRSAKADWSVIAVFDRWDMKDGGKPRIVAQWRGHTEMYTLAWKAAALSRYYHDALLVVESNSLETHDDMRGVDGDQSYTIFQELRNADVRLYRRRAPADSVRGGNGNRYGFHTNAYTKPMIISGLIKAVNEGLYIERDEECLDEYLTYEQRANGSFGAIAGKHDDLLMTRAIGLHICFHEMELPWLMDPERLYANRRSYF